MTREQSESAALPAHQSGADDEVQRGPGEEDISTPLSGAAALGDG